MKAVTKKSLIWGMGIVLLLGLSLLYIFNFTKYQYPAYSEESHISGLLRPIKSSKDDIRTDVDTMFAYIDKTNQDQDALFDQVAKLVNSSENKDKEYQDIVTQYTDKKYSELKGMQLKTPEVAELRDYILESIEIGKKITSKKIVLSNIKSERDKQYDEYDNNFIFKPKPDSFFILNEESAGIIYYLNDLERYSMGKELGLNIYRNPSRFL